MARWQATENQVRASFLGVGVIGVASELLGVALRDDAGSGLVTGDVVLTVAAAVGYGRVWYRLVGRQFWDRWFR